MRINVLKLLRQRQARSAAILSLAGLAAGCSADVVRFDDGFYTGAVPQQATQIASASQPYPGDVDQVNTGSVSRGFAMPTYGANPGADVRTAAQNAPVSVAPSAGQGPGVSYGVASVERADLAPPAASPPAYPEAAAPAQAAAPAALAAPAEPGWSGAGAKVTLRSGETIYGLSKRFGIPAQAILAANGMSDAREAQAGQAIVIPNYTYGANAPVSAPDNDPKTRNAVVVPQTRGAPPSTLQEQAAQVSAAPAQQASGGSVVVESGDSLSAISRRTGVSVADLRKANGLSDDNIRIGQTLRIPAGGTQVASIDSAETRSDATAAAPKIETQPVEKAEPKPYEPPRQEAKVEQPAPAPATEPRTTVAREVKTDVATRAPAATGIDQFRWPVQGRVVKSFGEKVGTRRNDGINISVPRGTPVKAAENGVVIYAGDGLKEFGNTVLVKHANGLVTVYGHADEITVERGATVKRGQEIAKAGMTGDTEIPVVHFEVRKDSAPVDPMTYLQ